MAKFQISGVTDSVAKDPATGNILRTKFLCQRPVDTDGLIVPAFAPEVIASKGQAFAVWIESNSINEATNEAFNPAEIIAAKLKAAKLAGKQLFIQCKLSNIEQSDPKPGDSAKGNGSKVYQTITFQIDRSHPRNLVEVEPAGWTV
jgi:hypothetical protein